MSVVPKWVPGWTFALAGIAGSVLFLAYIGFQPGPAFEGHWGRWLPTLGLATLGLIAMLASLVSLRSRRWAATLALVPSAALLVLWAWALHHFDDRSAEFFKSTAFGRWLDDCWLVFPLLVVPGVYWLFSRTTPPALVRPVHMAWKIVGIAFLLTVVPVASALMSICFEECWFRDLCRPVPPFTAQSRPQQTVFTARVLRGFAPPKLRGVVKESGALARVEKSFWGLRRWDQGLAIVLTPSQDRNSFFEGGQVYFIDADRLDGALTRFLPIFRDHLCTQTARIEDAEIQLRVLRDGLPANGLRILGETIRLRKENNSSYYHEKRYRELMSP